MTVGQTVLLVGGTGRTGRRVLEQLLSRDGDVRAPAMPEGQRRASCPVQRYRRTWPQ